MGKTADKLQGMVRRTVALDVVTAAPGSPAGRPLNGVAAALNVADGDTFNAHKILNHFDKLQKIAAGQTVFPITVEIDPSNRCNHRCQWCVSLLSHMSQRLALE